MLFSLNYVLILLYNSMCSLFVELDILKVSIWLMTLWAYFWSKAYITSILKNQGFFFPIRSYFGGNRVFTYNLYPPTHTLQIISRLLVMLNTMRMLCKCLSYYVGKGIVMRKKSIQSVHYRCNFRFRVS